MGLFGSKSDHPMADIKSAQKLLSDVPKNDPLKALLEITDWIESVTDNANFHADQRFEVLNLLDESARPHMRKLVREFFSSPALAKFQENRIWMALYAFFSHNELSYVKLLTAYRNSDKGNSAIRASLPLIAARGMYAVMGKLKMIAARYDPVEIQCWEHLGQFYLHATEHQYVNEQVKLYSTSTQGTSAKNIFASSLMWYAPGSTSLRPLHMHLAERITYHFCKHLVLESQATANSLLCFDPAHPGAPLRVTPETKTFAGMCFLGAGDVRPQLEALLKQLEKNIVPQDINLGGVYEADEVKVAARHLLSSWGAPPPMRRHARHQVKINMQVAVDLERILERGISAQDFENFSADAGISTWEVEDISATGFRCVLLVKNANGVKIGSLLATKPENVDHHAIGIVRRLSRDDRNQLHVGVEILSKQIENISLHTRVGSRKSAEQSALWLKMAADEKGEILLILSPHTFLMNRSMNTLLDGKGCLLIPLALLERGYDYDLARYRKVEEDANAAADEAY